LAQTVVEYSQTNAAIKLDATLKQFFALAQRARLFVGGDTGADALGGGGGRADCDALRADFFAAEWAVCDG
jgi:hypothetical protein